MTSKERAFSRSRSPPSPPSFSFVPPPPDLEDDNNASRIHLPPNTSSSESYLEGSIPNVLVDRRLNPSQKRPGMGSRGDSLMEILSGMSEEEGTEEERAGLLGNAETTEVGGEEDDDTGGVGDGGPSRTAHSRSKSRVRKLKWYQRPSPVWFLPGTLIMSISLGMIISPKLEIYNQLMCRALTTEEDQSTMMTMPFEDSLQLNCRVEYQSQKEGVGKWKVEDQDQEWSKRCRQNPVVQQGVARLAITLVLIMGILSSLTTGFWGSLSDRKGRKPIIALALLGTIIMDATFLAVVKYHDVVGYRFLLVGPAIDGLLGGMSTASAATNAYLSDCTSPGSRARIFSILGGLLFGGIALGPTLGSISIRLTQNVLTPFYIALILHSFYFTMVVLVFPESLSQERKDHAQERYDEERVLAKEQEKEKDDIAREKGVMALSLVRVRREALRPFGFLKPLKLLVPVKRGERKEDDLPILLSREVGGSLSGRGGGRDWTLVKIGIGFAAYVLNVSVISTKILYTGFKFGWGPQESGYYLSFIGACRVFVLIIALPTLIRFFRKSPPEPKMEKPEEGTEAYKEWEKEKKFVRVVADSHFDLLLAKSSIIIDMIGYSLMALNGGSETKFLIATFVQSLGGGATPALQSFALAHASARDSGRLFASLSVLQSLASQVIGPLIYGTVYSATVRTFPEMMFWVVCGMFFVSFIAMSTVRLRVWIGKTGEVVVKGGKEEEAEIASRKKGKSKVMTVQGQGQETGGPIRGRSLTRKVGNTLSESGFSLRGAEAEE